MKLMVLLIKNLELIELDFLNYKLGLFLWHAMLMLIIGNNLNNKFYLNYSY